uniref:Uncharacterized protein n=1 Tax=Rhizophora mucronata TaxID=61149 RepID=A0A2P2J066_RHIMU
MDLIICLFCSRPLHKL